MSSPRSFTLLGLYSLLCWFLLFVSVLTPAVFSGLLVWRVGKCSQAISSMCPDFILIKANHCQCQAFIHVSVILLSSFHSTRETLIPGIEIMVALKLSAQRWQLPACVGLALRAATGPRSSIALDIQPFRSYRAHRKQPPFCSLANVSDRCFYS